MEAGELQGIRRVHHGHNLKRTRLSQNIKQEALCELVHLNQPTISKYERMPVICDEILQRFAKAMNVSIDDLKTMEEETPMVLFENNNTFTDNKGEVDFIGNTCDESNNHTANYNPIDKVSELFERLLKEKDERISILEKRINELEQSKK